MTSSTSPGRSLSPQAAETADRTAPGPCSGIGIGSHSSRRKFVGNAAALALLPVAAAAWPGTAPELPDRKWYEAAAAMKKMAESWGDQAYGAVLVLDGQLVGEGPSRVIKKQDNDAHAEREAIRDAQRRLGRAQLTGAVLYSTSRPCSRCEAAAAQARVSRMFFGPSLVDAGAPRATAGHGRPMSALSR